MHILLDLPVPQFSAIELQLSLRGLRRINPHLPKQALPITPDILLKFARILDLKNPYFAVFWSLATIAFFIMARKSNLVPDKVHTFDPKKQLRRCDIISDENGMVVVLKWSKTNKFSDRLLMLPILPIKNSLLCPKYAYHNMCNVVPGVPPQASAFSLPVKGGFVPFTYPQVQSTLKELVSIVGLDPTQYSSHSFRRGGATSAFRAQVPPELIQLQGDWASDAYKQYLQFNLKDRAIVSLRLGQYIQQFERAGSPSVQ